MTIAPMGSIPLLAPDPFSPKFELELIHQLHSLIPPITGRILNESLDTGEAAQRVSAPFHESHPEIPWPDLLPPVAKKKR